MREATFIYIFVGLCGLGLFVIGIYTLYGAGWSLIAGAASCFAVSGFIRRGLKRET